MDLTNVLQASKSTESAMRATGLQTLKVQGALRNTLNTVIRCYTKNNGVLVEVGVRRSSVLNVVGSCQHWSRLGLRRWVRVCCGPGYVLSRLPGAACCQC